MAELMDGLRKPTSDKELLAYQQVVCCKCKHEIPLKQGIFTKGCGPVDLYGMSDHAHMIKDDGECIFFKAKE